MFTQQQKNPAPGPTSAAKEVALQPHQELKSLCTQYGVSDQAYEECVSLEAKRKTSDNLPNVMVDGKDVKSPGYFLVKLPPTDPRAYVLGHITKSEQSIDSYAKQTVIDAVTLKNNGFYVLLKSKTLDQKDQKASQTPLIQGKIDYSQFDIIGQGYAWLGKRGNLTFDYWINSRIPGDAVTAPLLKKFSEDVTNEAKSNILFARIRTNNGRNNIIDALGYYWHECYFQEEMLEGTNSSDQKEQKYGLLYFNQNRQAELNKRARTSLTALLGDDERSDFIMRDFQFSSIVAAEKMIVDINTLASNAIFQQFLIKNPNLEVRDFYNIPQLAELARENLLTPTTALFVLKDDHRPSYLPYQSYSYVENISSFLVALHKANVLNSKLIAFIEKNKNPQELIFALYRLIKPNLLNKVIPLLFLRPDEAVPMIEIIEKLHTNNLLNDRVFPLLQKSQLAPSRNYCNVISFLKAHNLATDPLIEKVLLSDARELENLPHVARLLDGVLSDRTVDIYTFTAVIPCEHPFLDKNRDLAIWKMDLLLSLNIDRIYDVRSVIEHYYKGLLDSNKDKLVSFVVWLKSSSVNSLAILHKRIIAGERFSEIVPCVTKPMLLPKPPQTSLLPGLSVFSLSPQTKTLDKENGVAMSKSQSKTS